MRLRYAEVVHRTVADPAAAIVAAARLASTQDEGSGSWDGMVEFVGNYTAFHQLLGRNSADAASSQEEPLSP